MEAKQSLDISESRLVKSSIVADLVRGKNIGEAFAILKFTPKVGADVVEKSYAFCNRKR